MALGNGSVRFSGQSNQENPPAEGRSALADDRLDEIELGGVEGLGASDSEAAQDGSRHALGADGVPPGLERVGGSSAFGLSTKAESFEWDVRSYTIKLRTGGTRTILKDIVGRAQSGSLMAILGPSGSGKTSLLDCLSLRNRTFEGSLMLDDHPLKSSFFAHTGYVHQNEMFLSHLTCREHLTFHSINRMSYKFSTEQCIMRVEEVLAEVDLMRVADSQIGGGAFYVTKGLSGGERKRLNIATELIFDPSILLLDEPTSGLDAVMGEMICLLLQQLACMAPKRIVMAAIHTPSSKMFTMFTHLLILTSHGQVAYMGRRSEMLPFLEGLGFVCPGNYNPADFVLELASAKVVNTNLGIGGVSPDGTASSEAKDAGSGASVSSMTGFSTSGVAAKLGEAVLVTSEAHLRLVEACTQQLLGDYNRLPSDARHKEMLSVAGSRSSFFTQFRTNLWRSWLQQSREVMGMVVSLVMNLLLGVIFGILYLNQVQGSWRNTAGFLFALNVTLLISSAIQVTLHTPGDFNLLLREYYTGCNSSVPYFLGRSLAAMPFSLIYMGMAVVPYFMTGLARNGMAFLWYCVISALLIFGSQSVGYLSSSFSSNPVVGLALMPVLVTPMILFSGMLYERQSVRPFLRWIQDLSLVNYSYASYVINEARYASDQKVASMLVSFLQVRQRDWSSYMLLLFVLGIGYRFLAGAVLTVRVRNCKPV